MTRLSDLLTPIRTGKLVLPWSPVTPPGGLGIPADNNVLIPETAEQWTALGIPVPTVSYLCQETTGNLIPVIGSVEMAPTGTGHTYGNTVAGWTGTFVGLPQATGVRWGSDDASLDIGLNENYCVLVYALVSAATGNRRFIGATTTSNGIWVISTGVPQSRCNSAGVNGLIDHRSATIVHPWLWSRDADNNITATFTDLEQITNTHIDAAQVGLQCIGSPDAGDAPEARVRFWNIWKAPSRAITKADLTTLGWSLSY